MKVLSAALAIIAGLTAYFGIALFRKLSLRKQWLDIPNQRSSHKEPVPRGAGLIVVLVCLAGYILASILTGATVSWAYFIGAVMVAGISWLDDLYSLAFFWRLCVHILAAYFLVAFDGHWNSIDLGNGFSFSLGWIGVPVTILWIVWVINAYNFMDGIDGIAGVQGLAASGAWAFIASETADGVYAYSLILFAALIAFIFHNWSPAKVFIGDVGSAFLGFTFAAMPLLMKNAATESNYSSRFPIAAILILWPFVFDTVVTMVRRAVRGEVIWRAHREHLYQRLVIVGFSHSTVAAIYGMFALVTAFTAVLITTRESGILVIPLLCIVFVISILLTVAVWKSERHAPLSAQSSEG